MQEDLESQENLEDLMEDLIAKPLVAKARDFYRTPAYIVRAMYRMYTRGPDNRPCTLKEVGAAYKVTYQNVQALFKRRGYKMRSTGYIIHKVKHRKKRRIEPPKVYKKVELLPSPTELSLLIQWENRRKKRKTGNRGVLSDTMIPHE